MRDTSKRKCGELLFYVKVGGREDRQETELEAEVEEREQKQHCMVRPLVSGFTPQPYEFLPLKLAQA